MEDSQGDSDGWSTTAGLHDAQSQPQDVRRSENVGIDQDNE